MLGDDFNKRQLILKRLKPDFEKLGIDDEDIMNSIANELDIMAGLILDSYRSRKLSLKEKIIKVHHKNNHDREFNSLL